jgi:hypothetical protein
MQSMVFFGRKTELCLLFIVEIQGVKVTIDKLILTDLIQVKRMIH